MFAFKLYFPFYLELWDFYIKIFPYVLPSFSFLVPFSYLIKFGGSVLHLDDQQNSLVITIIGVTSATGRVLVGILTEHLAKAKFLAFTAIVMINGLSCNLFDSFNLVFFFSRAKILSFSVSKRPLIMLWLCCV
jgi:predicted MFS family arabinose efflux permease